MSSTTRVLVTLLAALAIVISTKANAGVFVSVNASPPSIPADGKSCSQILVTVLGQTGAPVADDTEVRLTTSAGDITPLVYTTGGRAVGILTPSTVPQIAAITAIANGVSGSVQVEFTSSEYGGVATGAGTIRMTGGSLAYCVDRDTVQASSGVSMEYKGITIHAISAQVSQTSGQIRAQGEVSVTKEHTTLTADAMVCDTRTDRIRLLDSKTQPSVSTFDVAKLRKIGAENASDNGRDIASSESVDGNTWIISKRLVLIPGEKILFFNASIYVGDSKVIKMPYYSYSYQKRESILQQIRYSSTDGMTVDFPFFYQVTDATTGALKLRYAANGNEAGGYYRPKKGMSMGLEQDYNIGDRNQGRVFVDAITSSSRTFELGHHFDYGSMLTGGRADLSARYQPSSTYAKGIYNTTLNVTGNLRAYNYSLSGYVGGSRIQQYNPLDPSTMNYFDQSTGNVRATFRPRSPIVAKGFGRLTPSLTWGYGNVISPTGGMASTRLYQSLGLSFSRGSSGSGKMGLSFDGTTAFTATARGETGGSLRMGPTLTNRWAGGNLSLSYNLNLQRGTTDTGYSSERHQLGCMLFLGGGSRWVASSFVNYGLDSGRLNLFSTLNYHLMRHWNLRSSYSLNQFKDQINGIFQYSYRRVGVYRPLGVYEIGVAYSPDGQDFGLDRNKRVWLELNSSAF